MKKLVPLLLLCVLFLRCPTDSSSQVGGGVYGPPFTPGVTENDLKLWKSGAWGNRTLSATGFSVDSTTVSIATTYTQAGSCVGDTIGELCQTDLFGGTGRLDLGGGTLELPFGASGTVDDTGEVTLDTTSEQLIVKSDDSPVHVFDDRRDHLITIDNPQASDNYFVWRPQMAITLISVDCIAVGGTATADIEECSSTGTSCVDSDADPVSCTTTGGNDDSITDSAIDANDFVNINIVSVSSTTQLHLTITYRVTRDG